MRPRQNGRHFADHISSAFSWMKIPILHNISLKYVPWGLIDNIAALIQIMARCRIGDKPLSGAMLVCFTNAYMRHSASMSKYILSNTWLIFNTSTPNVFTMTWIILSLNTYKTPHIKMINNGLSKKICHQTLKIVVLLDARNANCKKNNIFTIPWFLILRLQFFEV